MLHWEECIDCRNNYPVYSHRRNRNKICSNCMSTKQEVTWNKLQVINNGNIVEREDV